MLVCLLPAGGEEVTAATPGWTVRLEQYRQRIANGDAAVWAEMLSDQDFGINLAALRELPPDRLPDMRSKVVNLALTSRVLPLRIAASELLAKYASSALMTAISERIEGRPDRWALDALGILASDEAMETLKKVISESDDPEMIQYAFRVLARNPGEAGLKLLSAIATDQGRAPAVRVEAVRSLGRYHFAETMRVLISLLDSTDLEIVDAVWQSLIDLTGKSFVPERKVWEPWWTNAEQGFIWNDKDKLPSIRQEPVSEDELTAAIDLGTDWLVRHQDSDGRFNAINYSASDNFAAGKGRHNTDVCMTSLAILSFIAAGIKGNGEFDTRRAAACERAVKWLVTVPRTPGDYRSANTVTFVHEQGAAAWALAEYVAAGHKEYTQHLHDAIRIAMKYRDGDKVWGYANMPGNTSNSCVSLWYACAFAAARHAGIDMPRDGWDAIIDWFDYATIEYSGYVFNANMKEPSEAMTGVGLMAKSFSLFDMSAAVHKRSTSLLLVREPERCSFYDLYCYSLGLAGSPWLEAQAFRWKVQSYFLSRQNRSEDLAQQGSWDPGDDIWESSRLYGAGMAIPCLALDRGNLSCLKGPMPGR
jgi:hypothetical protein